jgi:hypothetical protein
VSLSVPNSVTDAKAVKVAVVPLTVISCFNILTLLPLVNVNSFVLVFTDGLPNVQLLYAGCDIRLIVLLAVIVYDKLTNVSSVSPD